jgi:hypothetical protein
MSYVNLNNPANFQLQEFEQLGFRYIVTGRPTISGETYRTIFVLADAVVTATCPNGDSLSSETLVAGTIIHGFFESVSVASGSLLAYKAGPITAQEIYDFYKAYVYANGGIIEGESCAVTEIAALLAEGLYSMASLVLIPSGYKVGTVYSERPTDSNGQLTFTRNSEATRVNSEGLVEKVRTNILTYSNTFSNGAWTKLLVTVTGGQEGYDGTNNAWLLQITDPIGRLEGFPFLNNLVTLSIYAKAGTTNVLTLAQLNAYSYVTCDLSNGTFTGQGGSVVYRNIESVGNGWYRIQLASTGGTLTGITIAPVGIVGDNVYIQNVQLEYGNIATDYIPTTTASVSVGPVANLPRLDYSGGATCPSLLLEPQTTALNQSSEQLDSVYWTQTGTTTTANQIVSPDGYQNADLVAATNAVGNRVEQTGFSLSGSHTFSIFLKKGTSTRSLWYDGGKGVQIDWAVDGTPTVTAFSGGPAPASFGSVDYGNGWHRVWFQDTYSGTYVMRLFPDRIGTTGTVYAWGANLTPTSYLQSYIPTLGSAVTRLADACSKTGVSSLIGQTEGILFVDFVYDTKSGSNRFSLSDGTTNNWIFIGTPEGGSTNVSRFYIRTNNVVWVDVGASSYFTFGERYKLALAYKSGDWAVYGNGTLLYSGTSTIQAVSSPLSVFNFFSVSGASAASAEKINQALIFKTRLTNAQLAALTTL